MVKRLWNSVIPVRLRRSGSPGDRAPETDHGEPGQEAGQTREREEIFPATEDLHNRPLNPVNPFIGFSQRPPDEATETMRLEIPTRTILKVIGTLVIIWLLMQVLTILLLLFLATLLCLALLPPVRRLERRGMPRVAAAVSVYVVLLLVAVGFFGVIVPPLVDQGDNLIDNAPEYADNFENVLDRYPAIREQIDNLTGTGESQAATGTGESATGGVAAVDAETVTVGAATILRIGASVVGGVANVFFVVVLTFYLLIEGERTWRYFARLMKPRLRYRFHRLGPELTNVVSGYMIGQAINSSLFGLFTLVTLVVLDVPHFLLLAILAAVMDAIPIVGVPVATIATMAVALAVSWQTSLIVLVLFLVYQQFENYVLLPRVFGNTLQVSALSILVGVLVGGQLLGVLGIILSLPVTAAIPVIERVWREEIPPEVEQMEEAGVSGPTPPTTPSGNG